MKGNYEMGQPLPSENTLAITLGVARSTVRQAVGALEKEGLVKRIKGKGSYFRGLAKDEPAQRLEVFSLILPDIITGLYPTLVKGFDHQAGEIHQQVMICNSAFDINKQGNIILQMIDKKVAGVALVPALTPLTPPFHVRQLQEHGIPVVFCHRPVQESVAPLITCDPVQVSRLAGEAFLDLGHRQIAFFARYRYLLPEANENGLRQVLSEHGRDLPETQVYYGTSIDDSPGERTARSKALKAMLNAAEPVTAIFCHGDEEAEQIHQLATEMGVRVPEDLSIIGFGDCHERTGVFRNRLTSVAVNEFDLGATAARVLNEMKTGERPLDSDGIIFMPLTLVEGTTLGEAPKQPAKV
jgi:DNA-binding LacI/PurR family transcriptional regulator